jgi:hypothetical protein
MHAGQCTIIEVAVSCKDTFNSSLRLWAAQKTDKYANLATTVCQELQLQVQHTAFVVGFMGVVTALPHYGALHLPQSCNLQLD